MFMKTVVAIAVPFTLGWIGIVLWLGAKALGIFDVIALTHSEFSVSNIDVCLHPNAAKASCGVNVLTTKSLGALYFGLLAIKPRPLVYCWPIKEVRDPRFPNDWCRRYRWRMASQNQR